MDTSDLGAAAQRVVTAARQTIASSGDDWGTSEILAHLVAANRNFTDVLAKAIGGAESSPFTNRGALQRPYLDAIVRAAGPREMVATFDTSVREMLDTCAALDEDRLTMPVDASFWENGEVIFEGRMPLAQLFGVIQGHMDGHAQQLTAEPATAGS